jgi:hypothetical protein
MAKIEGFCAPGVYDPPNYTQAIKVTEAQTILFLSGQVAREPDGSVAHRGDFTGRVRSVLRAIEALRNGSNEINEEKALSARPMRGSNKARKKGGCHV